MAQTPIEELELSGNVSNLNRARRREAEKTPLTPEQRTEVAQLDELIAQAMKACRKGSTRDGKRNPAFANLASLVKTRELILKGKKPGTKSTQETLAEVDELLGRTPKVN